MRDRELVDRTKEDNAVNTVAKAFVGTEWTAVTFTQHPFAILKMEKVGNENVGKGASCNVETHRAVAITAEGFVC